MPSSITTGEPKVWREFSHTLIAATTFLFCLGIAFLLIVDPYDSGRLGGFGRPGVPEQLPHFANASRARDPRYDAALFGNSHVQALKPERLSALTGARFVSLMMPGTLAIEQLDTLEWYLSVQHSPVAIVIGTDLYWCQHHNVQNSVYPYWLYSRSFTYYFSELISYRNLREANKRLAYLWSGKGGIKSDGYWDYSDIYKRIGLHDREKSRAVLAERRPYPSNEEGSYPYLDHLARLMSRIPPETAVVLLRPPVFRTALPDASTAEGANFAACLTRLQRIAGLRARTALLDLTRRSGANDDQDNFYDWVHYRDRMAVLVEQEVANTLRRLR